MPTTRGRADKLHQQACLGLYLPGEGTGCLSEADVSADRAFPVEPESHLLSFHGQRNAVAGAVPDQFGLDGVR